MRQLLVAQLAPRSLGVCTGGVKEPSPLARITLSLRLTNESQLHTVDITIDDGRTQKSVLRHLDVEAVTPDTIPLSVAVSVDELLRASWAELSTERPPVLLAKKSVPRPSAPNAPRVAPARNWLGINTEISALGE